MNPTFALLLGVLVAVCALATAIIGLCTALLQGQRRTREHLNRQDRSISEVHVLVNSNLSAVKADLATALARIEHLDQALEEVSRAAHSVPDQTTTQALKETADIAAAAAPLVPDGGVPANLSVAPTILPDES